MLLLSLLFWVLVVLLFYTYLGYPIALYFVSTIRKRPIQTGNELPSVSIIIPAHNEEKIIEEKIENTLNLDYPMKLSQVIVVSDASTDGTNSLVKEFEDRAVQLIVNEQKRGKSYGLNQAFQIAKGEILIFTDSNSMFEQQTLRKVVRNFADPHVGLVSGSTHYFSREMDRSLIESMGTYARLEKWIRKMESKSGSCVGADGAVFAVRKRLYRPLGDGDINDFVIPLAILRQGYRAVFDEEVFCREEHSADLSREFLRQVRISNRTIRALINNLDLLNPFRYGLFAWMLFSHKMLRFLFPGLFLLALCINCLLIFSFSSIYLVTFSGLAAVTILAWLCGKYGFKAPSLFKSFIYMNTAILVAWKGIFSNQTFVTWKDEGGSKSELP